MRYYPVFLNLKGRLCVVIGGGSVAERKVRGLLRAGANIKVVSPGITKGLEELVRGGQIHYINRTYQREDIKDAFLVIAATADVDINKAVFNDARNIPVNVVDVPELCSFIVPSIVSRGALTIAISTSGVSPAMAKSIREELEELFPEEIEDFFQFLEEIRMKIKDSGLDSKTRESLFKEIGGRRVLRLLLQRGAKDAIDEIYDILNKRGIQCD